MHVDVESSDRFGGAGGAFSSRKLRRNVPIESCIPSVTGALGTARSLTFTPLVDWLS